MNDLSARRRAIFDSAAWGPARPENFRTTRAIIDIRVVSRKKKKRSPVRAVSVFAESATRDPITKVDNSGIERGLCGEQTISQTPFDGEIKFKRDPRSVLPRNST